MQGNPKAKASIGESFDKNSVVVMANYDNGKSEEITNYTVSPKTFTETGTQTVTITSGEFTETVNVNVVGVTFNESDSDFVS